MEHLIEFIEKWGYVGVFLGAMIEGESIILVACIMAYLGYLNIYKLTIIAFCGTLFADQALFYVGRHYGQAILDRFPRFKKPAEKAFKLLHRWELMFILSFRFIYGIRIVSPIVIGSAGILPKRFIPLNFISAIIWTVVSCSVGYALGGIVESLDFSIVERYIFLISGGLLVLLIGAGYMAWKKLH